ncbi:MAG TPA: hypothetical protein DHW42_06525, partial [Candidatus Marinimicrobia bacterium]|nr:hypothetical protein [Candidatus Neomarinimicrobiota bacterium]
MKTMMKVVILLLATLTLAFGEILPNGGLEGNIPNYWHPEGTDAILEWGTDAWRTGGHSLKIARSYTAVGDNLYQYGGLEANVPNYWFHEGADAYFEWATDESRTGGHSLKIARFYTATGQNLYPDGGFEAVNPNYWNTGGTSSTADIIWATDESRTGGHSLKIVKTNSDGTAIWQSDDLYRYWSCFVEPNKGMEVGAWVKTQGVNTSPANDEKIQVIYNFYSAAGVNLLGAPLALDVPQVDANSDGWVEVKSTDLLSFPVTVDSITVSFQFGANATGTVWMDDAFIRNTTEDEWVGDFFNANV